MKNIIFIFILLLSVYTSAQTLYTDEKGVKIFYEIQQTEKFVLCEGNSYSDENFSKEKIYIWKVTFGIENGYSGSIVPRGVGIATISISPNPIKPYSHNYCNYKYLKNYEPNSIQRHLDQSLFVWSIRDHKVEEIKSEETIIATTYLYLYEGQTPKLTNWQFLGYRLKKDFNSYDPILNDIVIDSKPVVLTDNKKKEKATNIKTKYNDKIVATEILAVKIDEINLDATKGVDTNSMIAKETKPKNEAKAKKISLDNTKVTPLDSIIVKEIKPTNDDESMNGNLSIKCPGEKALEYKEKSNTSTDLSEQRAYSWLVLYYTYKCECEMGSPRSDQLVPMINNVVDSYVANADSAYGKISKVTKCRHQL
jgi:hypothetical protein